jgi:hypothetical protein
MDGITVSGTGTVQPIMLDQPKIEIGLEEPSRKGAAMAQRKHTGLPHTSTCMAASAITNTISITVTGYARHRGAATRLIGAVIITGTTAVIGIGGEASGGWSTARR